MKKPISRDIMSDKEEFNNQVIALARSAEHLKIKPNDVSNTIHMNENDKERMVKLQKIIAKIGL